jgi:hypothetical protein
MSPRLPIALAAGFCLALAMSSHVPAQEPVPKKIEAPRPGMAQPKPVTPPTPQAMPTSPTLVALDFKGQTAVEVIRALGERSGGQVEVFNVNDPRLTEQRITLESTTPVPLWDAVDRLSAAISIGRSVTWAGPLGTHRPRIQLQANFSYGLNGSAQPVDYGLGTYVGPFRLGPVVVHEHFDRVFLRPRSGASADDTPPFYADIPLVAEPSIIWVQTGPLRDLEAVDDLGQSLLDPKLADNMLGRPASAVEVHGPPRNLRIPLARAARPSKALATLRGILPIEVARRPTAPTKVVPLEGASGQTFRDGDLAIVVREYKVGADGKAVLKLNARIEGSRGESTSGPKQHLVEARLWSIYYHQIELADVQGKALTLPGSTGPDAKGGLNMDYTYTPIPGTKSYPPTRLRFFRPDWIPWDLPIAFKDLPLP